MCFDLREEVTRDGGHCVIRSCMFALFTTFYQGDKIKEDGVAGVGSKHG
jgi:hypothetical protein